MLKALRFSAVLFVVPIGCTRSAVDRAPPAPASASPSGAVVVAPDASAWPVEVEAARGCTLAERPVTIEDGSGKPSAQVSESLENLRVLAEGASVIVTWERDATVKTGDGWHSPVVAQRGAGGALRVSTLPVMSMACATAGHAAPLSVDEPFVTWGVMNRRGFEIWKAMPEYVGEFPELRAKAPPARFRGTPRSSVSDLATSRRVAIAATWETGCETPCNCEHGFARAVWIHPLANAKAKATRLATVGQDEARLVPAIAMGEERGIAAWRAGGALHLVWLDGDGAVAGPEVIFARGDVGAPAVAIAGTKAVVVWAARAAKDAPYALAWMAVEHGATSLPAPRAIATEESAFAPAVVTDGKAAVLAWMQGDQGTRGAVFATRLAVDGGDAGAAGAAALRVSDADETNARDPEVSGTVDAPVLVYGAFGKDRPGGVPRLATLACR